MLSVVSGAALVVISSFAFWYFLPRNGVEHRLANNSGVSSMIMIGIMTVFTFGIAIVWNGFAG